MPVMFCSTFQLQFIIHTVRSLGAACAGVSKVSVNKARTNEMDQNDVKSEALTAGSMQVAVQSEFLHATANC
jgi:hypothetical protein